jgi:predicted CDP-diglyceride synthetase/phosphatidate cytidylyltransferase
LQKDTDNSDNDEPDPDEKVAGPPKSPMEIAQEKYRKFFTRSIWGVVMILVFALILYLGHAFVSIFVVVLQIMVFKEMVSLRYIEAKERKLWGFRTLHWYK